MWGGAFLLDSGVKETILFSLEEKNEISLKNIENHFSGLGSEDAIEGLKSVGIYSRWRDGIYQSPFIHCVDQNFNISTLVFRKWNNRFVFNNNLFEINYEKKVVL
jgi:hypothetical protein